MIDIDLREHYFCEWRPNKRDMLLRGLATRYHEACELYDRMVCTGPVVDGSIMPATHHEMALINRNAREVRRRIVADAEREGFTWRELADAIGKWHVSTPNI